MIQADKLVKLLASVKGLGAAQEMWTRELDGVKGRVQHYSACVRHLRILATGLGCLIGTVDESSYDKPRAITTELLSLAGELESVVDRYSESGAALWPPVASSCYASFMRGELGLEFLSLTWDASTFCWAALLRWWERADQSMTLREELLIGTWQD